MISTGSAYSKRTMHKMIIEAWEGRAFELNEEKRRQPVKFVRTGGGEYIPPGRGESLPTETAGASSSSAAAVISGSLPTEAFERFNVWPLLKLKIRFMFSQF